MAKLFSADNVIMYANLSICLHLFGGSSVAVAEDAFGDRHPRSASEPSQSPVIIDGHLGRPCHHATSLVFTR